MLSHIEMAIQELRIDTASSGNEQLSKPVAKKEQARVLKLESNLYGIGINLPELFRRVKAKFSGKKE